LSRQQQFIIVENYPPIFLPIRIIVSLMMTAECSTFGSNTLRNLDFNAKENIGGSDVVIDPLHLIL
jgi:hypothetical protein